MSGSNTTDPLLSTPELLWTCQKLKSTEGPDLDRLSVGAKFDLICEGPEVTEWKLPPQFQWESEEKKWTLHSLKTIEATPSKIHLQVVGYKAGEFSGPFSITGSDQKVRVEKLDWKIPSVLGDQQGQQVQMVPPFPALKIAYPIWLWLGVAVILAIIMSFSILAWRRRKRRAELISKLSEFEKFGTPYQQFHRELRALLRAYEGVQTENDQKSPEKYFQVLENLFKTYLARNFKVPALNWSEKQVIADVRKRYKKQFKLFGPLLLRIFVEIQRAKKTKKVNYTDVRQLHEMMRRFVEGLEVNQRGPS